MKKSKKKIIILQNDGGELANQLWTFTSVYAYCLEKDFDCQNYSFFEYGQYFDIPINNKLIKFLFFKPFKNHRARRNNPKNKFWRFFYKIYAKTFIYFFKNRVASSINSDGKKIYLSPTEENDLLIKIENDTLPIYFSGWLFRNPEGLIKYRKEIINYFKPKKIYTKTAEIKIEKLKNKYKNVIGIHVRQDDYKIFKNGLYLISQKRVSEILNEYLISTGKNSQNTMFAFTSDGPINKNLFKKYNITINKGNPIEDLYLLSLCDTIIGSNSSFGNFAAYYGDKPHIIFQKEKMDWAYYKNKNQYFLNKYCTMAN